MAVNSQFALFFKHPADPHYKEIVILGIFAHSQLKLSDLLSLKFIEIKNFRKVKMLIDQAFYTTEEHETF